MVMAASEASLMAQTLLCKWSHTPNLAESST